VESAPRVPLADIEVPLGTTGTAAAVRRAPAPVVASVGNPLEPGITPAVNVARAS